MEGSKWFIGAMYSVQVSQKSIGIFGGPSHPQMKHVFVLHLPFHVHPYVHTLPNGTYPILHCVTSYQDEEEASKYVDRLGGLGRQGGG